jgi:hypothetical protein
MGVGVSLNAAMIQAMVDKGLSGQDIADIAKAGEAKVDRTAAERQARHRAKSRAERNAVTSRCDHPIEEDHTPGSHVSPSGENENTAIRRNGWPVIPDWMPARPWNAYIETRKNLTPNAVGLMIGKLERWRAQGHDPGEILDTSTLNGWKGLFEPKEPQNGRSGLHPANDRTSVRGSRPNPALDMVLEAERELQAEAFREGSGADWPARPALPSH